MRFFRWPRRLALVVASIVTVSAASENGAQAALQELRAFATTGRVLHLAAHPDDENTQLIAYLSRGRGYATAYLSITRGDGGQNLLGPQFDEKLGVARTQELLAARRIDGGRQFFTRAIDFGFSKSPQETLAIWGHDEVLGDVVRVIRRFRPDVIVTRFPIPPGSGGHGHHTASAILAVEAFKLAGDPQAYPEQIAAGLAPWQPRRVLWNGSSFFGRSELDANPTVRVDISGQDPVTGESFVSLATRSRRMHKTQALGEAGQRDITTEPFILLAGDAPTKDLMDGVDTSWRRIPGGEGIGTRAEELIARFDVSNPAASVPALLELRQRLAALPASVEVREKSAQLDRVLTRCVGLTVEAVAQRGDVVPGETLPIDVRVATTASLPVRWTAVQAGDETAAPRVEVRGGSPASQRLTYAVPPGQPVTQPYWLREPGAAGTYRVLDPGLIGTPENPFDLPVRVTVEIGGHALTVIEPVTYRARVETAEGAPAFDRVVVIPPASFTFKSPVALFRAGEQRRIAVEVVAARNGIAGDLALSGPDGWRISPAHPVTLARAGDRLTFEFDVTAPTEPAVGSVTLGARIDGRKWTTTAVKVEYPHIPMQLLQPGARLKVVSADIAAKGRTVGYIPGAGDDVAEAIVQLGYRVTPLAPDDLVVARLRAFDAVVIGVRAFNTRDDLGAAMPALAEYVAGGGVVVAQYNWVRNLKTETLAPYRVTLSNSRVTNEEAPVTLLVPDHPALTTPNAITAADFAGWVQERGVYFPSAWDPAFVPLLAMSDPGEKPLDGSLLVAHHGKGYYVYTSLAFFRQLPAGVPGAYRLFANLLSLGK